VSTSHEVERVYVTLVGIPTSRATILSFRHPEQHGRPENMVKQLGSNLTEKDPALRPKLAKPSDDGAAPRFPVESHSPCFLDAFLPVNNAAKRNGVEGFLHSPSPSFVFNVLSFSTEKHRVHNVNQASSFF